MYAFTVVYQLNYRVQAIYILTQAFLADADRNPLHLPIHFQNIRDLLPDLKKGDLATVPGATHARHSTQTSHLEGALLKLQAGDTQATQQAEALRETLAISMKNWSKNVSRRECTIRTLPH